ncbi:UDP-glucuronate:xylan alpha-glucuronosyltransferase [Thalictrum thalictroides]|uniref:Hexosyltransferase n=1 Tax=Thalictrum thalictroides TaxID=46969 RepID=A0A7J6X361_THATH|nr:UDP-glucuronate:xylan alpha-glucuronosyltransferase [Thalictrum thalictroides]
MRGTIGSLSSPTERHRSFGSKRFQRNKSLKDSEKPLHVFNQEKCCSGKFSTLKIILVIIVCVTLVTFFCCPTEYANNHISKSGSRPGFVERWIWESHVADPRYKSYIDIGWDQILSIFGQLSKIHGQLRIGLLNFNNTEIDQWKRLIQGVEHIVLQLDHVRNDVTWESLYPEWIDEEEEFEVPTCPSLPELKVPQKIRFDVVAVKLPCHKSENWSRDVARLHLQLAAARLVASVKGQNAVYVLFVTDCFPTPNLFTCKDLVVREKNAWLYKPQLNTLREKLQLPVGSCELAVPLKANGRVYSGTLHREAYATILHSAHVYVCGAIAAAQSIRMVGSSRDLIILVDETISDYHKEGLVAAGWKIRTIQRIRNPKAERDAYNEWNYSKFRLWQLTDYDKIIFIDADLLILRNIDFLFGMPEITAIGNNATLFNSGVMLVEPSNCTFQLLMDHINEIESYNGGDQGYLNEIFTWWHRIPKHMNFLKHFWEGDEEEKKEMKTRLFGANPPILYVLHYLGLKPWLCFRDYDCNWNVDILQEFASNVAHRRWWMVHDAMPENLQKFCLLRSKQKAALEWDRRQAEKGNYTNGHWKRKIKDPRLNACFEDFCFWESMLWHWGETNWTDNATTTPTTPTITKEKLPTL